jgi:phage virion morphogenesis protein
MSDSIEIRIDNKELQDYLIQLAEKTSDLRPLMRNIAGIMADSVEENFAQQGRPKWQQLAKSTIEQRVKAGKWPGMILQLSQGGLASSITSHYDENSAVVGTNKVYAAIHQFGGKAGRGKNVEIPTRPYLKLGDSENTEILTEVKKYLQE